MAKRREPQKRNHTSFTSETAREAARKSAEVRRAKAKERELARQAKQEQAAVVPLIPREFRDEKGRFKPGISPNPGGRALSLGKRVRERVATDELIDFHLAIMRLDEGELARFGLKPSDVTPYLQRDSAQWLSDRGWGRPHQTSSVEHVQEAGSLADLPDDELARIAGLAS